MRNETEIKIRGISKDIVKILDNKAKEKGFNSRNEYLKCYLEQLALLDKTKEIESNYAILTERISKVLEYNTLALNKFCNECLIDLESTVEDERQVNLYNE